MPTTAVVAAVSAASQRQATVTITLTTTLLTTTAVVMVHLVHSQHMLQENKLLAQVTTLYAYELLP
jgi:hypothetical protein